MNKFKEDIRAKADLQREYRNQRKTVHRVGEKTMEPWQAASSHYVNRIALAHMYIAYGELRGKPVEVTCAKSKKEFSRKVIDDIKNHYSPESIMPAAEASVVKETGILGAIKSFFS